MMTIRDDFTRFPWMKISRKKDNAEGEFKRSLADARTDGDVETAQSDIGDEFWCRFSKVCVDNRSKQEFTTPDIVQYDGEAERGLALKETNR